MEHLYQREKQLIEGFNDMVFCYYKNQHQNSSNKEKEKRTLLSNTPNTEITAAIKAYFRAEGDKAGFYVAPDVSSPEWLFDMTWFYQIKGKLTTMMTEVELILESELNYSMNAIRYDFEKLLLASPNIPFKIFICLQGNKKLEEMKEYFNDAVQSCRSFVRGDSVIVLIGDDYDSGMFEVYKVIKT